jgi:hypothetical protein
MRRRLYVILPDVNTARQLADALLLARVDDRHMHFLARRDVSLAPLHEAGIWQKTDLRHAGFLGAGLGLVCGALFGVFLKLTPIEGLDIGVGTLMVCTLLGGLLGAWGATLIGVSTPSVKLRQFEAELDAGRVLLMVDVPVRRVPQIQRLLSDHCPQASDRGIDLTMPAFP